MTNPLEPGAPFPLTTGAPIVLITEVGDDTNGAAVHVQANDIIFTAHLDGQQAKVGVPIDMILEAVASYTRSHES